MSSDFRATVERICAGEEEAVYDLIDTYGPHIQRVVRRRLNQRMRSKFDSYDFVQMVWVSFFRDRDRIAEFNDADDLIRYLVTMARNKLIDESRRRIDYVKYNVGREECSLDSPDVPESSYARQETPSEIAIANECYHAMTEEQSERTRRIVEMRMNGATFEEIAAELGIHERTARLILKKLEQQPVAAGAVAGR